MKSARNQLPTQNYLKSILLYDPETGFLHWKGRPSSRMKSGVRAGYKNSYGYIKVKINGKSYMAQRIIWVMLKGDNALNELTGLDHIDHVRHNNIEENLRLATAQENNRNQSMSPRNTSGFTGVYWYESIEKWGVKISVKNKLLHLGTFINKSDAIKARKAANIKYGFHVNHGAAK
tara:strand:+ start:33 stop:560 length:528 start_codon:yes stop_codon:yes gene_type:complete